MKKFILFLTVFSCVFLYGCDLPHISIQIDYGDKDSSLESTFTADTQYSITLPEETVCKHSYNKGKCVYCNSIDSSYPYFAYDYLVDYVVKNGYKGNNLYTLEINKLNDGSYSLYLYYDSSKNIFKLSLTNRGSDNVFNVYVDIDVMGNCTFVAGFEIGGDIECAGVGRIDTYNYTSSTIITLTEYDGPSYAKTSFLDMCDASIDIVFMEFNTFIKNNSPYSLVDFGFSHYR